MRVTASPQPPMSRPVLTLLGLLPALVVLAACAPDEPAADPTLGEPGEEVRPAEAETPGGDPTPDEPVEDEPGSIELDLADLPAPGGARYVLWVVAAGQAQRMGVLDEPEDGRLTGTVTLDGLEPEAIEAVLVAVEGAQIADEPLTLLGGVVADGVADLAVEHDAALGAALDGASGTFLLGSPSDQTAPEQAGIWFLQVTAGGTDASLELAPPPEGWVYEAWGTRDGITLSAGRFEAADASSFDVPHNGPDPIPSLPGGDFVAQPPDDVEFPWELHGATVAVSLAPADLDPGAPLVIVLKGDTPDPADHHVDYDLARPQRRPTGTATIAG